MKLTILLFAISICLGASKKSDEVIEKFESGKVRSKTKYQGNDLLEAEAFFENGKTKLTTKRAGKSPKGYGPDSYTFKETDEEGHVLGEGSCWGPPLEPLNPYEISNKPKMNYGSEYCKELTGIRRFYSDENELTSETNYINGKIEGEATNVTADKIKKTTYKDGKKIKLVETDKKTGKLLKSEEYNSDGSKK